MCKQRTATSGNTIVIRDGHGVLLAPAGPLSDARQNAGDPLGSPVTF